MNADTEVRYCCGVRREPGCDSLGRSGDVCRQCRKFYPIAATLPAPPMGRACLLCGQPTRHARGDYCRRHQNPVSRANYTLRQQLGLANTSGSLPGGMSLQRYAELHGGEA